MTDTQPVVAPAQPDPGLDKHLTLAPAVALALTTVIGGGALALPGVALRQAGSAALWGWALAAVITIPLIAVFARLGARYPSAGGVAGFVDAGFGRHAAAGVEVVLIGTFGLGIPAIALSGGSYLAAVFGWRASVAWIGAVILLGLAAAVLLAGGRVSARVQLVLAAVLTAGLAATGLVGLLHSDADFSLPSPAATDWRLVLSVVGTVFFGFTGWEMVAFTAGEYENPRRDFPRAIAISFVVVVGVYLLLAAGVQATVDPADPAATTSPIAALMGTAVSSAAASLVAVLGVVILAANVIGAMWGASRLVYSSSSAKLVPRRLSALTGPRRTPRAAIIAVVVLFLLVVGASALGVLSPTTMFTISGQNFFVLYLVATVVFVKISPAGVSRVLGVVLTLGLAAIVVAGFQVAVLGYSAALFAVGLTVSVIRRSRGAQPSVLQ